MISVLTIVATSLWLRVWWVQRMENLIWPSWEAAIWLGLLLGQVSWLLNRLATRRVNWLARSLAMLAIVTYGAWMSAGPLPGTLTHRYWMWFIVGLASLAFMWASAVLRTLVAPSPASGAGAASSLPRLQTSLSDWMLLTAGLGTLLATARALPEASHVVTETARFFALPVLLLGWLTWKQADNRHWGNLAVSCLFGLMAAAFYSIWTDSITERMQLGVMVTLQGLCLSAGHWLSAATVGSSRHDRLLRSGAHQEHPDSAIQPDR